MILQQEDCVSTAWRRDAVNGKSYIIEAIRDLSAAIKRKKQILLTI